jgi:formylglycine-generating enzyme required for sulfatase activity
MSEIDGRPKKVSPYIHDHRWSLLGDHSRLLADLDARNFRPRSGGVRAGGGMVDPGSDQRPDPWLPIDNRDDIIFDRLVIHGPDKSPRRVSLRRLIVTTDAGIGKSDAINWFFYRFNRPDAGTLAFRLNAAELEGSLKDFKVTQHWLDAALENWMAGQIKGADPTGACLLPEGLQIVRRFRHTGHLVILIDGLDHVSGGFPNLKQLLQSGYWQSCRFILAGRPYALQTHFAELKLDEGWEFLRLEEFDEGQQRQYLGSRYDAIPPQARPALQNVLTIPRVLYYMRHHVTEAQFRLIRTAADVYWIAIRQMIKEAMNGSTEARRFGLKSNAQLPDQVSEPQLRSCRDLLAAVAYVMTLGVADRKRMSSGITAPNFERVIEGRMSEFEKQVSQRFDSIGFGLHEDMNALAAMNEFLSRGVFDSDVKGFREVEFRNRSLQEFLTAYYLCTKATTDDGNLWWDRLYLPHDPGSEQFYSVWQFVTEMTGTLRPGMDSDGTGPDVPSAILEECWLEAIEPLYRPTFEVVPSPHSGGEARGEAELPLRDARRSCEMIFRTWPQLQKLCDQQEPRAIEIRSRWLGEFESILAGNQGLDRQGDAKKLVDDFLLIPGGTFQMGSPPEKAAQMPEGQQRFWRNWYGRVSEARSNWQKHLDEVLDQLNLPSGRAGDNQRNAWTNLLNSGADEPTTEEFLQRMTGALYPSNETPREREQTVDAFRLGRSPVVNAWWRLFCPRHGLMNEFAHYERVSPTAKHPAIYENWFSAWCFSQWAHWKNRSCRLPWENEWEYAAKFGTPWDWRYWWSDEWKDGEGKITADGNWETDSTTVPDPAHANPMTKALDQIKGLGLMEMLGNVQEWCQDQYRAAYERTTDDEPGDASTSRCLRGGAFNLSPEYCRSASRVRLNPTYSDGNVGVRLSRAASD